MTLIPLKSSPEWQRAGVAAVFALCAHPLLIIPDPAIRHALTAVLMVITAGTLWRIASLAPPPEAMRCDAECGWWVRRCGQWYPVQMAATSMHSAIGALLTWRERDVVAASAFVLRHHNRNQWRRFSVLWQWAGRRPD